MVLNTMLVSPLRRARLWFVLVAVLAFSVSGCSRSTHPSHPVVGKWQYVNDTMTLEFFDDGTTKVSSSQHAKIIVLGHYKVIDDQHLEMWRDNKPNDRGQVEYHLNGDHMTFKNRRGADTELLRIRD